MRKFPPIFLLILFGSFSFFSFSQQSSKKIDSLLGALKVSVQDTNKVIILNTLSWELIQTAKYSEARNYALDANSLAKKLEFKKAFANSYNNIGITFYRQGNYAEALKNYFASLKIREEIGHKGGMAMVHNNIGLIYKEQGNYTEALKHLNSSLKLKNEIGDKAGSASTHNNIGTIYLGLGKYTQALESLLSSLKISEEIGDKRIIANCYINIGIINLGERNYTDAVKNFQAALNLSQVIRDKQLVATVYSKIGNAYSVQGELLQGLNNYLLSLKISEEIGDKRSIAECYINIAASYKDLGNYPEAFKNFNASLKICEEIGFKEGKAVIFTNLGDLNTLTNNYVEAREFLNKSLSLSIEMANSATILSTYNNLVRLDSATGEFEKALINYKFYTHYRDSSLNENNLKQIALIREQYEAEKKDKEILELTTDKLRLEAQQKITALYIKSKQDSLNIVQSENDRVRLVNEKIQAENRYKQKQIELLGYETRLQQLQIGTDSITLVMQKSEVDKNQEQLVLLSKEKDIQTLQLKKQKLAKKYFIAGLLLSGILIFFILRNFQNQRKINKLQKDSAEKEKVELQLQSLRAQLNPHFMFNSLNAIQELIVTERNELSQSYLERFARLLRLLLENANQPFISLHKELNFLELYLSLESLRIPDLKYSIEVDPNLKTAHVLTPNMMLQPYIENALWHGLQHKQGDKKLHLEIYRQNGAIHFIIKDNGVGRKKAAEFKSLYRNGHNSKGMELLSKRFSLLSKEYGQEIETKITDLSEYNGSTGTQVEIIVPASIAESNKVAVV